MAIKSMEDLLLDHLKDIYDAEKQITKALPKMAKAATSQELKQGFELHLQQTENQIKRLESVFEAMGKKPAGKKCKGMQGLIEEGQEIMEEEMDGEMKDAALIGAAQKVEHYEIAGYGTLTALAKQCGMSQVADMLAQNLQEEKMTDQKLTQIAEQSINRKAAS